MEKFKDKYRIPSSRAGWWDYSNTGFYFVTICTFNRENIFGKILNGVVELSELGVIVRQEWEKSFLIRTELYCDEYIIMPNHIHALVEIINKPEYKNNINVETQNINVETHGRASLPIRTPKSISSFVAGFKSSATKRINQFRQQPKQPVWQSRFYDHIILNESDYFNIKNYIVENPSNWEKDKLFAK
ncbi:MAG: transposase [Ignavibacteriaceae bacterium]